MIALLCSVQTEAEHLAARMAASRSETLGTKTFISGALAGREVLLCAGGMGKANAAHAATLLAARFSPVALLIFGVGGAYPSAGARVGDVAIAREEIAGDEGVLTAEGFRDAEFIGIPLLKTSASVVFSTFPASPALLDHALRSLAGRARAGSFVTLSTCTGTSSRARELEARYHGLCENMEGAAAAQVAALHGIPWMEVRGISNIVEDRDPGQWDIPRAAQAAQEAVLRVLEAWPA